MHLKNRIKTLVVLSGLLANGSVALAAGTACPSVDTISQKTEGNLIKYSATVNGANWKGASSKEYGASEDLLKTLNFNAARFMGSGKNAKVICQYEGDRGLGGGISLVLGSAERVTGGTWKTVNATTWDCETKGAPQNCTFEAR